MRIQPDEPSGAYAEGSFSVRSPWRCDCLHGVLGAFMRGQLHENRSPFDYYRRLRKLRSYVESHISEPLSLEDASRIVGLEKKYFSTFFSQKTGMGFRDWSAALRVERAKVLMSQSDHSITRVSVAVGFRDLRTFERAFKKHTGVTPMVFKQSIRPDRRGPRGRSHSAHDR